MAIALLDSAGGAATGFFPPWLAALGMVVASVWIVSLAVFLCGRTSHADDDLPKKKPAAEKTRMPINVAPPKEMSSSRSGSTMVDKTGMYGAAYVSGIAAGGSHGHGGGEGGGGGGDLPRKKSAAEKTSRPSSVPVKARSSAGSGSTMVDPTGMYGVAYVSGVDAGGCHGHGGGGGYGGGGGCGGGGGGGGDGGGGGGGGGGCGGC